MWDKLPMELRHEIIGMANTMHSISLRDRFDIDELRKSDTFKAIIIGKDPIEKALMTSEILYHVHNIPRACVFSDGDNLSKHIPGLFISDFSDVEHRLTEIYENQKKHKKHLLIILEMKSTHLDLLKSEIVYKIYQFGHYFKMSIVVSVDFVLDLNTIIFSSTDYIFCLKHINLNELRLLRTYLDYGIFANNSQFVKKLRSYTEEYGCMVWNNKIWTPRKDVAFWYESKPRQFRFGSDEFWKYGLNNCK